MMRGLTCLRIAARYRTDDDPHDAVLGKPDGPFHFAGEHLGHVGVWQDGAILSVRRAINALDRRLRCRQC